MGTVRALLGCVYFIFLGGFTVVLDSHCLSSLLPFKLNVGKLGHQSKYSTCTLQFGRINLIPHYYPVAQCKKPGCLGFLGSEILPSYVGIIINRYKHPY